MAQFKSMRVMQKEIEDAIERADMVGLGELAMDYAKSIGTLGKEYGYGEDAETYDIQRNASSDELESLKKLYNERFGYGGDEIGNGRELSEDIQQEDGGSIVQIAQSQGNFIPDTDNRVEEKDIFEED